MALPGSTIGNRVVELGIDLLLLICYSCDLCACLIALSLGCFPAWNSYDISIYVYANMLISLTLTEKLPDSFALHTYEYNSLVSRPSVTVIGTVSEQ